MQLYFSHHILIAEEMFKVNLWKKMFDSEKLLVYKKSKEFNLEIKNEILAIEKLDRISKDQLRRAAMSVMLNIAEGTSRFSKADKRNFYVIARGSVIECVAILDLLTSEKVISVETYNNFYSKAEEISKNALCNDKILGSQKDRVSSKKVF